MSKDIAPGEFRFSNVHANFLLDWALQHALQDDDLFLFYKGVIQCYGEAMANYQAKRMYSEEEVIKIVEKSRETGLTAEYLLLTKQFKKK